MDSNISIQPHEPACDSHFHTGVANRHMSHKRKDEAIRWFENADVKAHSYQSLFNDAVAAVYNVDNKTEHSHLSETIEKSGASLATPLASNMELKLMPAAHELGMLVEMRMKCLILAEGKKSWGHRLPTLWGKIRYGIRQQVKEHYANYVQREQMPGWITDGRIEKDIGNIGDDFIEWRYEPRPDDDILLKYTILVGINHVLEYAMLRYR